MAYFRKRGKTWSFTVTVSGKGEKRRQKSGYGYSTKKEAQDAVTIILSDIQNEDYLAPNTVLFIDYATKNWLAGYSRSVKPGSVRVRTHEISVLAKYFGSDTKLINITAMLYERKLLEIFDKFAHNTACGVHGTARMIFKKAKKEGLIKKDPTEFFRPPRIVLSLEDAKECEQIKYLEKNELTRFLKIAQEVGLDEDFLFFKTLAYTGMRIGELCALTWADVDLVNLEISINKTYYNPANTPVSYGLVSPKTKAGIRVIDISKELVKNFTEHRLAQQFVQSKCYSWHKEGFVFTHLDFPGYPKYPKLMGWRMTKILKAANLCTTLSPHSLRHTHCALLAEAGASLEEIQSRLGQVDDDTTKKVYLHITKARKKETAQKFENLMSGLL